MRKTLPADGIARADLVANPLTGIVGDAVIEVIKRESRFQHVPLQHDLPTGVIVIIAAVSVGVANTSK